MYPPDHPVEWINESDRQSLSLKNIADVAGSGHGTLLVHALPEGSSFELFQEVIAHLRAPDGCPWDRKQTHGSLRPYLLEETYEALTALDAEDPGKMAEELGDLLLQIVLHAQIGSETGTFRMTDILRGIHDKIIRRHPHVFGDVVVHDEGGVLVNWERLKAEERAVNGEPEKGMLDGVPVALPALTQAQEIQERAARVGFDWQDIEPVRRKILEEPGEVDMAGDSVEREKELGDLYWPWSTWFAGTEWMLRAHCGRRISGSATVFPILRSAPAKPASRSCRCPLKKWTSGGRKPKTWNKLNGRGNSRPFFVA